MRIDDPSHPIHTGYGNIKTAADRFAEAKGVRPRAIPNSTLGEVICLPNAERLWIPIRKNAHTAIFNGIWNGHAPWFPVQGPDLPRYADWKRIVMWRNPFDRLQSAYSFFTHNNCPEDIPDPRAYPDSDWIVRICETPDSTRNPHVATQHRIATQYFTDLPDIIVRWDFDQMKNELCIQEIPLSNNSPKMEFDWQPEAVLMVREEYAIDLKVWQEGA